MVNWDLVHDELLALDAALGAQLARLDVIAQADLPASKDLLVGELQVVQRLVRGHAGTIDGHLPGIDRPGTEDQLQRFIEQLGVELVLCGAKCHSVMTTLSQQLQQAEALDAVRLMVGDLFLAGERCTNLAEFLGSAA